MKALAINVVVVAVALCLAMPVGLATASGNGPVHDTSGNLEGTFNGGLIPTALSKTNPSRVNLAFSAKFVTNDGAPPPAVTAVSFETDRHLGLDLRGRPRCSLAALRNTDTRAATEACPRALIGSGFDDVEIRPRSAARQPVIGGSEVLIFNGGTRSGVTTLFIHLHIREPASAALVFPLKVRPIKRPGRFGLSWRATIPKIADGLGSLTSINLTLRKGLYATCPDGRLFAHGAAEFADGSALSFRLSRECIGVQGPGRAARSDLVLPLPHVHSTISAAPSPVPAPSAGRVPVSLRLADSISTGDGSHPPAATEVRFEIDRQLGLHLSGVPRCPWSPIQSYPAFDWSSCEAAKVGGGLIKWELPFPETEPSQAGGAATAYRGNRNKLLIRTHVPAPVSAEVVIPMALSQRSGGSYGLSATASVPKVAGGDGSLTYLGLRFRKGLFSAACPKGRLRFGVADTFIDGSRAGASLVAAC